MAQATTEDEKQILALHRFQDPIQRPISTSTLDSSDFESTNDGESQIFTPRSQHFGNAHPDLPPSYDESQAQVFEGPSPTYPYEYPPGVANHSDITVFRTEIPQDPVLHATSREENQSQVERSGGSDENWEERSVPPVLVSPQVSNLLNDALLFTETPSPDVRSRPPLRVPLAVPALSRASGPVKFARFYASMLEIHSINASQFVDFIDGLNALCTASSFSVNTYQSRNPITTFEMTRDDNDIALQDTIHAFIALSNTQFFNPRGLHVQLSDLSQLADLVNMSNAAIRKTVLEEVLRNSRAGIDVPAAANGAAGAASQALVPYIEPLTAAVPEPKKRNEAMENIAETLAALDIESRDDVNRDMESRDGCPRSSRGRHSHGSRSIDGDNLSRKQSWDDWAQSKKKYWEDWGKQKEEYWANWGKMQENFWQKWGQQQSKNWGKFGEHIERTVSGPPSSWTRGAAQEPQGQEGPGFARFGFGGPGRGGRGFGQFGGPGHGGREFGRGGRGFGRYGGGPFNRVGPFGGGLFQRGGPFTGRGDFQLPPVVHQMPDPTAQPFIPTPITPPRTQGMHMPLPPPIPTSSSTFPPIPVTHGSHIPPIPSIPYPGAHMPPPCSVPGPSSPFDIRGDLLSDHNDDHSDAASISSDSSSSSSDSDATCVTTDPEAVFAQKVAEIERMASQARSRGQRSSEDINREKARALLTAENKKSKQELQQSLRLKKRELKVSGNKRAWKNSLKAQYRAYKREAKAGRRAWKNAHKGEYRAWKQEMRQQKQIARREKREGKMKAWEYKRAAKAADWHQKKQEFVHGRHGSHGSYEEGEAVEEDVELLAKEMLWVVVKNLGESK